MAAVENSHDGFCPPFIEDKNEKKFGHFCNSSTSERLTYFKRFLFWKQDQITYIQMTGIFFSGFLGILKCFGSLHNNFLF